MILGLTGGIGSGKSLCSRWFEERGVPIVDADVIARALLAPQSALLPLIAESFGAEVLSADGSLNRVVLRAKIFANEEARLKLNAIMHPAIREEITKQLKMLQEQSALVILSAPLLVENHLAASCHAVLVVDVPEDVQIERTMQRDGCDESQARAIMASQCSRSKRLSMANFVVDNQGTIAETHAQLHCLSKLLAW
ncbi:MAG: dephospho-CoA kinase [Cardiobacteriaceae bacterium]|nr:dephospho-CoA kinase [Cardiobacteriaceae bacterium]